MTNTFLMISRDEADLAKLRLLSGSELVHPGNLTSGIELPELLPYASHQLSSGRDHKRL